MAERRLRADRSRASRGAGSGPGALGLIRRQRGEVVRRDDAVPAQPVPQNDAAGNGPGATDRRRAPGARPPHDGSAASSVPGSGCRGRGGTGRTARLGSGMGISAAAERRDTRGGPAAGALEPQHPLERRRTLPKAGCGRGRRLCGIAARYRRSGSRGRARPGTRARTTKKSRTPGRR
jgi:hypothetical protein